MYVLGMSRSGIFASESESESLDFEPILIQYFCFSFKKNKDEQQIVVRTSLIFYFVSIFKH